MKTAVEWLVEQMTQGDFIALPKREWIEQAKEMEKEQHKQTWTEGLYCGTGDKQAFEQYYNETFKSE